MKKRNGLFLFFCIMIMIIQNSCGIVYLKGSIPEYREYEYIIESSIPEKISVLNDNVPLEISQSADDKIHVIYFEADDQEEIYDIAESGNSLIIKKLSKPNHGIFIFGDEGNTEDYKKVKLQLLLPQNFNGNISASTSEGNISVTSIHSRAMELKTEMGDIVLTDILITEKLILKTDYGNIRGNLNEKISDFSIGLKGDFFKSNIDNVAYGEKSMKLTVEYGTINITFDE